MFLVVILCLNLIVCWVFWGSRLYLWPAGPKELYWRSNKSGIAFEKTNRHQGLTWSDTRGLSDAVTWRDLQGAQEGVSIFHKWEEVGPFGPEGRLEISISKDHQTVRSFSSLFLSQIPFSGRSCVMGLMESPACEGDEASCQWPGEPAWKYIFQILQKHCRFSQQLNSHLIRDTQEEVKTQLSWSQKPNPKKLCEIINWFHLLNFR